MWHAMRCTSALRHTPSLEGGGRKRGRGKGFCRCVSLKARRARVCLRLLPSLLAAPPFMDGLPLRLKEPTTGQLSTHPTDLVSQLGFRNCTVAKALALRFQDRPPVAHATPSTICCTEAAKNFRAPTAHRSSQMMVGVCHCLQS